MQQYYSRRQGDSQEISGFLESFEKMSNSELIESYKSALKLGIVGVHAQGLRLLAMRLAFIRRFNKSPIEFTDNCIIRISDCFEI
ncbi:hypothetical protein [Aequorivita antarctica]|uniref:Uncharacterized protein n=1 Tax=Aequorivita antarctica TaxID=153266 RepID=A0A5C6Z2K2_9FLAO|nr:hypothetical protein [Aequorivita antarctica]TXD73925.1 hypothetical protein ESU54_05495 [Aequorivita antarctica]SRX73355.1 hypothetical protein AEQU3_00791 [Aequorivita antarctica]